VAKEYKLVCCSSIPVDGIKVDIRPKENPPAYAAPV